MLAKSANKKLANGGLLALVGASYFLSACTPTPVYATTPTNKPTSAKIQIATVRPTATYTAEPMAIYTATATPELYNFTFQSFHDYNGNGAMDKGEPLLDNILIKTSVGECTTTKKGKCEIVGVPAGR